MPVDVFGSLLEFTYNGISAPLISLKERGSHDQAEHKKTDRDGSSSEGTGRNAIVYVARLAFINGLKRGPVETWSSLYPQTYNNFYNEILKRDTGFLGHPERGLINVKVLEWESELNADQRGGRYVDITYRETDDDVAVLAPAAFTTLATAAGDLTEALAALKPPLPIKGADGLSLLDLIADIANLGNTLDLLENKLFGRIENMISVVGGLFDSFEKGPDPTLLPKFTAVSQGLRDQKTQLLSRDKPVALHMTRRQQTPAHLALVLKSTVGDLLALNPQLAGVAVIPVASVVAFYK